MSLTTAEMLRYLVGDELNVHGIYDDTKNIATYGIGVVVSQRHHWPSFLIMAAQSKQEWTEKFITRIGDKKNKKGRLIRAGQARLMSGAFFSTGKSDPKLTGALKQAATEAAQQYIAHHWYHKASTELATGPGKRVGTEAARAVAAEIDILAKDPVQLATGKLSEYTRVVDGASKKIGVTLTDGQYLALLSVCWNSPNDARRIIDRTLKGYRESGRAVAPAFNGSVCSPSPADRLSEDVYKDWSQEVRTGFKPKQGNAPGVFYRRDKNANDFINNTPLVDPDEVHENNLLKILLYYKTGRMPA
jgi:hypothetical protein